MFKLESYITPLILSRVERYVKNVRTEDSQVSLWGGDAVFNNLDLKLDVLEKELKLPFRLVSGHIHELQIHVPWTRLQSEPIVLTINTIECVLSLPNKNPSVSGDSDRSSASVKKGKKWKTEDATPPGYIQGLINKIVSNIQVVCNNLILKYVEDDLVLSLNVRNGSLVSADSSWEPAFTELSAAELVLRKLLSVSDLTVCLDRRTSLGKIEKYEDPLLYRFSLTGRLAWCYQTQHSKFPYRTFFHLMAGKMDFSVTEGQVPLLNRLFTLFNDLLNGDLCQEGPCDETTPEGAWGMSATEFTGYSEQRGSSQPDPDKVEAEEAVSLGGLLWNVGSSLGSALLPIQWEEEEEDEESSGQGPTANSLQDYLSLGIYVKEFRLALKVTQKSKGPRQLFTPFLYLNLHGLFFELNRLGAGWMNISGGVSQLIVSPPPSRGEKGAPDGLPNYILAGCETDGFISGSLFQSLTVPSDKLECSLKSPEFDQNTAKSCDEHIEAKNETAMLGRTPALGFDYIYTIEFPSDATSEDISDLCSNLEQSNLPERALGRVVMGPTNIDIDFVAAKRFVFLASLGAMCGVDDNQTCQHEHQFKPTKLEIPTKEEIDCLENNNPCRKFQLTFLHPNIVFHYPTVGGTDLTRLELGVQCLDFCMVMPMYSLRNVKIASVMHPPSKVILNNCHNTVTGTVENLWSKLVCGQITMNFINLDKGKFAMKVLQYQQYWKNIYQKQGDILIELDSFDMKLSEGQCLLLLGLVDNIFGEAVRKQDRSGTKITEKRMAKSFSDLEIADYSYAVATMLGPSIMLHGSRLKWSWTWTTRINTTLLSLNQFSVLYGIASKSASTQFLTIAQGNPSKQGECKVPSATASSAPSTPGKAARDTPVIPWFQLVLQFPVGFDCQFVPPIFNLTMGATELLIAPKFVPFAARLFRRKNLFSLGDPGTAKDVNKHHGGDSGFKSCEASPHVAEMSNSIGSSKSPYLTYGELFRSSLISIRTEPINFFLIEEFPVCYKMTDAVYATVNLFKSLSPESSILLVNSPKVEGYSSGGRIDTLALQCHPVLFPTTVWISGKNTLPLTVNLTEFSIQLFKEYEILPPVSTRCTVGMNKGSVRSLAVAIHVDISPVIFSMHGDHLSKIVNIGRAVLAASFCLFEESKNSETRSKTAEQVPLIDDSNGTLWQKSLAGSFSETASATLLSNSLCSELARNDDGCESGQTLSVWTQWTLPACGIVLTGGGSQSMRISCSCEDISLSYDGQMKYSKLKLRVQSCHSIVEVKEGENEWKLGPYPGWIINCKSGPLNQLISPNDYSSCFEDVHHDPRTDDLGEKASSSTISRTTGLINVTVTRAKVENVHRKMKLPTISRESMLNDQEHRILSEIDVNILPTDLFISIDNLVFLQSFLSPLLGLVQERKSSSDEGDSLTSKSASPIQAMASMNNNDLPLVYFKCKHLQIFLHNTRQHNASNLWPLPDFLLLHIGRLGLTCQVENPLSRILVNDSLFYAAAEASLLEIPGSPIEDRQYQCDLEDAGLYTGTWKEITAVMKKPSKPLLRTMSENPALEWNSASQIPTGRIKQIKQTQMIPIFQSLRARLMTAPAIIYRKNCEQFTQDCLVAGISIELNFLTDFDIYLSMKQIQFLLPLLQTLIDTFCGSTIAISEPCSEIPFEQDVSVQFSSNNVEYLVPAEILFTSNNMRLLSYDLDDNSSSSSGKAVPLVFIHLMQPHIFTTLSTNSQKASFSIYDMSVRYSGTSKEICTDACYLPVSGDYPCTILKTSLCKANPHSGIRPPFFSLAVTGFLGDCMASHIKLNRPFQLEYDLDKVNELVKSLQCCIVQLNEINEHKGHDATPYNNGQLKTCNFHLEMSESCTISVEDSCLQEQRMKLALKLARVLVESGIEEACDNRKLALTSSFEHLKLTFSFQDQTYPLLQPVNINMKVNLNLDLTNSLTHGTVAMQCSKVQLNLGPTHVYMATHLQNHFTKFFPVAESYSPTKTNEDNDLRENDSDEHFCDDLRLGTFTYSDVSEGSSSIPLPYMVLFGQNSLTWTYSKPRTLTKMVILPLPLSFADESNTESESVSCQLLYWSNLRSSWIQYQKFSLTEGSITHVDLPMHTDRGCEYAETWRIDLAPQGNIRHEISKSLLSAVRVDSHQSSSMIPHFQCILDVPYVSVNICNHLHRMGTIPSGRLKGLTFDQSLPKIQPVFTFKFQSVCVEGTFWKKLGLKINFCFDAAIDYTDFLFLSQQTCLKLSEFKAKVLSQHDSCDAFLDLRTADFKVGPFMLHCAKESGTLWNQAIASLSSNVPGDFVPFTHIIIANDTSLMLHYGQIDTDEQLKIKSKACALYAWRSHKAKRRLRVAIDSFASGWSESFAIIPGESFLQIGNGQFLNISIEQISVNRILVNFLGTANIINCLEHPLEAKLVGGGSSDDEKILINCQKRHTSVILGTDHVAMKIRYYGMFTPWSGEIALVSPRKSFLVRLPQKDKGKNSTIWCSICTEKEGNIAKYLIIFSPMYTLTSLIPGSLKAFLECENIQTELNLPAMNTTKELILPCSSDNKFNLSFQCSSDYPPSSPITISWGIIDQVRESKATEKQGNIRKLLGQFLTQSPSNTEERRLLDSLSVLNVTEQAATDCRVKFEEYHPITNTLMIKVLPRCLVVNKTGLPILFQSGSGSSWLIEPNSVFHPAVNDSQFKFGSMGLKGSEEWGSWLELAQQDWTYITLLPHSDQIVPVSGEMFYKICGEGEISIFTICAKSVEGIRILELKPMFVVVNQVAKFKFIIKPSVDRAKMSLLECHHLHSSGVDCEVHIEDDDTKQVPILTWNEINFGDGQLQFILQLDAIAHTDGLEIRSSSLHANRTILIPTDEDKRQCLSFPSNVQNQSAIQILVISYRLDGQIFIFLTIDDRPQLFLSNCLDVPVKFRELDEIAYDLRPQGDAYHTFHWQQEGFPFVEEQPSKSLISFRLLSNENLSDWSRCVDTTVTQETFISLPGHGDVKVVVDTSSLVTALMLLPVSHIEIPAKDIRSRIAEKSSGEPNILASPTYVGSKIDLSPLPTDLSRTSSVQSLVMIDPSHIKKTAASSCICGICIQCSHPTILTAVIKVDEISLSFTDDLVNYDEIQEIIRITMDKIELSLLPDLRPKSKQNYFHSISQNYVVKSSVLNFQVDNQLFNRGLFYFPVVCHISADAQNSLPEQRHFLNLTLNLVSMQNSNHILQCHTSFGPLSLNIEDTLLYVLKEYLTKIVDIFTSSKITPDLLDEGIPPLALLSIQSYRPLIFLERIVIEDVQLRLSVHASIKLFLGLEDTQIYLSKFDKKSVWCSGYSIGHAISRHYLSGALFKAGWVVGSLDVIGNPAAFTRNISEGLKDFLALPCEGILNGPWGFVVGLSHGSSSLVKHVSAGTITSITNFAKSISRNLDKLSLDEEHLKRNEEVRRIKPRGLSEGLVNGLSGVGISILGAIGGLAHHPIQVLMTDGISPLLLAGGVSKGLVGMITKPLGGAAEFVSQTGQGLLMGSGWTREHYARRPNIPVLVIDQTSSVLKYLWKIFFEMDAVIACVDASLQENNSFHPIICVLTSEYLVLMNEDEDSVRTIYNLKNVRLVPCSEDPTAIYVHVYNHGEGLEDANVLGSAANRTAQFVLDTLQYLDNMSEEKEGVKPAQIDDTEAAYKVDLPAVDVEHQIHLPPKLVEWFVMITEDTKLELLNCNN